MRDTVIQKFNEVYGYAPQYIVRAPGRANLIGGHTEVTYGIDRPILSSTLIGEVEREKLITPRGAAPGDHRRAC